MKKVADLPVGQDMATAGRVLEPGANCWCIDQAKRASLLIDAEAYFSRLEQSFRKARHSILIIGWDFDGRIKLRPEGDPKGIQLGPFLGSLAEARPELEIHILVWSVAVLHGSSAPKELLLNNSWLEAPNIQLRLDTQHPIYGSHHQKCVVIDDKVAFVGGIDLTTGRWDTPSHSQSNERRINPDGDEYGPVHDLQMIVEGPIATMLGDMARTRWHHATGEVITPPRQRPDQERADPWPGDLQPEFTDVAVGIARTESSWSGDPPVREVFALALDAIAAAEHSLYIEAQYFANFAIGEKIAERLGEENGPDVVIIVTRESRGLFEHFAMGSNRDRLLRRLKRADRFDRLRVYYPVVCHSKEVQEILVHAKLIIVDDMLLRIGSSNINNRSFGLDTECDIAIEASTDAAKIAIADIRARLLAEHLDVSFDHVREVINGPNSLIRAIESLNTRPRGLQPFKIDPTKGPTRPFFGTKLLDPKKPFEPLWWLRRKMRI